MATITISRETGAGGTYIALRVAEKLGYTCVDKEIINWIAQKTGKSKDELLPFDQDTYDRMTVFFQEALQNMAIGGRVFHQFGLGPLDFSSIELFPPVPPEENAARDYSDLLKGIMKELAERGNVVILGRGGQHILRSSPGTLHIRIVGDLEDRITRLAEEQKIERDKAAEVVQQRDDSARKFMGDVFDQDWADPHQYHFILNTSQMPIDTCVSLILKAVAERASPEWKEKP